MLPYLLRRVLWGGMLNQLPAFQFFMENDNDWLTNTGQRLSAAPHRVHGVRVQTVFPPDVTNPSATMAAHIP